MYLFCLHIVVANIAEYWPANTKPVSITQRKKLTVCFTEGRVNENRALVTFLPYMVAISITTFSYILDFNNIDWKFCTKIPKSNNTLSTILKHMYYHILVVLFNYNLYDIIINGILPVLLYVKPVLSFVLEEGGCTWNIS